MRVASPLFFLSLLFLLGCTSSVVTINHSTFSMTVPDLGNEQLMKTLSGDLRGVFMTNNQCAFNLTISQDSYLQAAQSLFEYFYSVDPDSLLDYQLVDNLAFLAYALPNNREGYVKIISCPSGFNYIADYQCSSVVLSEQRLEILALLDSMHC